MESAGSQECLRIVKWNRTRLMQPVWHDLTSNAMYSCYRQIWNGHLKHFSRPARPDSKSAESGPPVAQRRFIILDINRNRDPMRARHCRLPGMHANCTVETITSPLSGAKGTELIIANERYVQATIRGDVSYRVHVYRREEADS